ncbi:hypothetical protein ACIGXM_31585 [Kitasatospora sp. NPDC052896]|uniref:hypothetical protein n=1 Tax=Kitasatospora sp. NPDC052896 TaxID=3364061 RepID=UPI0037C7311B
MSARSCFSFSRARSALDEHAFEQYFLGRPVALGSISVPHTVQVGAPNSIGSAIDFCPGGETHDRDASSAQRRL